MANTKSAKKAIRSSKRKAGVNLIVKKNMKGAKKAVLNAVVAKDKKTAAGLLPKAYEAIDKAAKINVIHKNAAARYKSRITKKVNSL